MRKADHYWWRLPASGLGFLVFGLVTFVLGALVLPVVRLLSFDAARSRRLSRQIVGAGLRYFVWLFCALGVIHYRVTGRERLGRPGQIIVANHPSLIDVVFLLGFVPHATCIVKAQLFSHWITRGAARAAGYIPNAPTEDMIHAAEQALREGQTLVIFPEGTRTVPGRELNLLRGAANVAVRGASVLTPVFISVDPPTLAKNQPWHCIPIRRSSWTLRVGEDIDLRVYRIASVPIGSRALNAELRRLFEGADHD